MYVEVEAVEITNLDDKALYFNNGWVEPNETVELAQPIKLGIKTINMVNIGGKDKEDE